MSRPTLRKWWRRYQAEGEVGLIERSRRPRCSPGRKLRVKRLRNELRRLDGLPLALATIHKVLCRHGLNQLNRPKLNRKVSCKRYARPLPGDRVQMDVCKIAPRLYQYTAIDDCSRYQVVAVCPRKSAASTLAFLDQVVEEMPFSIQRIQTDRGQEFFAYKIQERLRDWRIKFRPIRPWSPHLNGKVERVQKTALEAFWPTVDLSDPELDRLLAEWQHFYNWDRPHDSLSGLAPIDRVCERIHDAPLGEEVEAAYDLDKEFIAPRQGWPRRRPN